MTSPIGVLLNLLVLAVYCAVAAGLGRAAARARAGGRTALTGLCAAAAVLVVATMFVLPNSPNPVTWLFVGVFVLSFGVAFAGARRVAVRV